MGASYPIIHCGFRCRRPDADAHQMPPCRLAQSLEEVLQVGIDARKHSAEWRTYVANTMRIPKVSILLAGFAIKLGPQSNGIGRMFRYGSLADIRARIWDVCFTPKSGPAQRRAPAMLSNPSPSHPI